MQRLLQFFEYAHLPEHLKAVSKPFGELAKHLATTLPNNAESTVALRKLLEAKDCAVRAVIEKPVTTDEPVRLLRVAEADAIRASVTEMTRG